jgi:hypothetical protein
MSDFFTFFAGVAIGGLLSWLITHLYYKKAGKDQQDELKKLESKLKPANTLKDFVVLLDTGSWSAVVVENTDIWMADENNIMQIEQGECNGDYIS